MFKSSFPDVGSYKIILTFYPLSEYGKFIPRSAGNNTQQKQQKQTERNCRLNSPDGKIKIPANHICIIHLPGLKRRKRVAALNSRNKKNISFLTIVNWSLYLRKSNYFFLGFNSNLASSLEDLGRAEGELFGDFQLLLLWGLKNKWKYQ